MCNLNQLLEQKIDGHKNDKKNRTNHIFKYDLGKNREQRFIYVYHHIILSYWYTLLTGMEINQNSNFVIIS